MNAWKYLLYHPIDKYANLETDSRFTANKYNNHDNNSNNWICHILNTHNTLDTVE